MGFGEGLMSSTEQSPWFWLVGGYMLSIHQNPIERVLLRCYDPAKPRWEMRRTGLDCMVLIFIPRKLQNQLIAVVQVGFGDLR